MLWLLGCVPATRLLREGGSEAIRGGKLHREERFTPPLLVRDLQADLAACADAGLFGRAGSGGRSDGDTFRVAEYCDPIARSREIGMFDAFFALWERLDMVRMELAADLGCELLPEMEIHYVRYPPGGYFKRHVDDYEEDRTDVTSSRCISFVCYLSDTDWSAEDGGALRVHAPAGKDVAFEDHLPESGLLVLFDSKSVEHEVLVTHRER
ncbi:MAG: hypothetical protein SGPRY_014288, partial [Prymnesium sp.]